MTLVSPIKHPDRPIRKCENCGNRTSLIYCPSIKCKNKKTVIVKDEGRI